MTDELTSCVEELETIAPHLSPADVEWCARFLPTENAAVDTYRVVIRAVAGGYYDAVVDVLRRGDGSLTWAEARTVVALASIVPTTPTAYVGPLVVPPYGRAYATLWADDEPTMRGWTRRLGIRWAAVGREGRSYATRVTEEVRLEALALGATAEVEAPWRDDDGR